MKETFGAETFASRTFACGTLRGAGAAALFALGAELALSAERTHYEHPNARSHFANMEIRTQFDNANARAHYATSQQRLQFDCPKE